MNRRLRRARLAVGGGHAIGVVAIGDCLDLLAGLETFQLGIASAAHHPAHAFHATLLRRLLRRSRFGGFFEESQQARTNAGILDTLERHVVVGHHGLRIGQPSVERAVVPDDSRRFERVGVTLEARQSAGLASPKPGQTWPRHVSVGFERMARRAGPEILLAAGCVAFLGKRRGEERNCRKRDDAVSAHLCHPCLRSEGI